MTVEILEKEALKLEPQEKMQLIELLRASLAVAQQKSIEEAWAQESEERLQAIREGKIQTFDGQQVIAQIRKQFSL